MIPELTGYPGFTELLETDQPFKESANYWKIGQENCDRHQIRQWNRQIARVLFS